VKPASYLTIRILATLRKFVAQQPSHMTFAQQGLLPWHPGLKAKSTNKVSHEPQDRVDKYFPDWMVLQQLSKWPIANK
jgi:hypothetical protein